MKKYKTKSGLSARIICTDMKAVRPVIVLVEQLDGSETIERLTEDLRYMVTAKDTYIKENNMGLADGMAWEKEHGCTEIDSNEDDIVGVLNKTPTSVTIHTNKHTIVLHLDPKELSHWLNKSDKKYAKKLYKALKKELK